MKLTVLGTGYVGLVSGAGLASKGHHVTCVDLRAEVVNQLNKGTPHIHELGLPALLKEIISAGRFHATTILEEALADSAIVIIAVGTPSANGRIDLGAIVTAARQIGNFLRKNKKFLSVVVKSTVVPGTTDTVVREAVENSSGLRLGEFGLGMNPEFLREGSALDDFLNPDRLVLGAEDDRTKGLLRELYAPWSCDVLAVNTRTAEFIKYANNCLLATQISATNELANLAAACGGIDIEEVMTGVHLDKRWNPISANGQRIRPPILTYLRAGCGFGGSCFPKDVQALRTLGADKGARMRLLQAVLDVNDGQAHQIAELVGNALGGLRGRRVALLGLAFKPDTDDVRESASLKIAADLVREGAMVVAHDPIATANGKAALADLPIEYISDWVTSLESVDAVVVATSWNEYQGLKDPACVSALKAKVIFDARRMFKPADFPNTRYLSVGRRI